VDLNNHDDFIQPKKPHQKNPQVITI